MSESKSDSKNEQQIVLGFQELRQECGMIHDKIQELEAEEMEHELVCKALEAMDGKRRCHRLIGDVLVERTVEEVLPAVVRNREGLKQAIETLKSQLHQKEKDLAEYQNKYKIRVRGEDEDQSPPTDKKEASKAVGAAQGVLVSG